MRLLLHYGLLSKSLPILPQPFTRLISSQYVDTSLYPPIEEIPIDKRWLQRKQSWISKVQCLPTMEQKLIELNMPKYYGYWSCVLNDKSPKINCSDYLKFITRTHVVPDIPDHYYDSNLINDIDKVVESIKSKVEDVILVHSKGLMKQCSSISFDTKTRSEKYNTTESFIQSLNCIFTAELSNAIPHLSPTSIDIKPRIEGFWFVGGYDLENRQRQALEKFPHLKKFIPEKRDISVRSTVHPTLAIRSEYSLPQVVPFHDELATSAYIPLAQSIPVTYGVASSHKAACIIPGFWPGVCAEHGHLFINARFDSEWRFGSSSLSLTSEFQSILACFTQAHSYAFYQGFTPLNELTYPIVQQSITTDGRMWRFHLYQMNTCVFHSEFSTDNERNNILWMTEDLPLFETVEGGSVKGLNEDVLKKIVSMYLKKGEVRENPSPYLTDYKYLMHHEAPLDYKKHFHSLFLDVCSERRTRLNKPYIAPWEKIYKICFNTRLRDARRKFFEAPHSKIKGPNSRRLDYYKLPYIPRVNRRNPKIRFYPRLDSEKLFVHDYKTIRKAKLKPDDKIAFRSFNVLPNSERYRSNKSTRKWTRFKKINYVGDEEDL